MIFLYSKLDIQHKGEGLGNLQDFVEEPIVTWNASGYLEVEFKYFLYGDLAEHMIPDAKLKTRIHSNDEVYHLFTIYEVEPDYIENTVQVRAEMTLLHELKDRVVPASTMRGTANEMIMFVKNKMDRDYPFVITGSTDRTVSIEHDNISAYELIFGEDGILKRTGAEIGFTDRGIRLSNRIGTIHRDELRESDFVSNLTVNELQGEDFVTRIIPFTTAMFDRPLRDGDRYTRETIETPTYGTPVISPNINNKLYKVRTKFVEYRNEPTEVPKYYNYQTERGTETLEMSQYIYEDVTALNQDASTFFEDNIGIDEPTTTISIETLGLAKGYYTYLRYLNGYDIVTIYVEPKPYLTNSSETYVVQVNETVYEPLSDNLVSIGFTNESTSLQDAYRNVNEGRISDQQLQAELQRERLNDLEDRLVNYVYNHDGFRLEFGNVLPPPDEYREGDLYYLETGEGIDIYQLVNGAWEFLVGQSTREIIEGKIEEIEQQAQGLSEAIEASDLKADEAKETAGLAKSASESAEAIAQQAQAEAESAKSSSSEALDKAILAGTDAETAKQNALDAVSQASEAKQNASDALVKVGEAVTKANEAFSQSNSAKTQAEQALEEAGFAKEDARTASTNAQQAIGTANEAKDKADAIPETINQTIIERGLTTGTQVERWIDDATGEMRLAIADVSGQIPNYIMGVTWDKSENPKLIRTDYLQDYAELEDFELLSADYNLTKTGVSAELSSLNTKKLDTNQFTDFKTNEFDVTVEGFSGRISDVENKKLDDDVFDSFRTNDYDVTVDGFRTNIESLQTEKLDDVEFESFKSNDYSVTVDGIKSSLTHIEGIIPDFVVGVVWDKSSNPKMKRTDYTEEMANLEDFESLTADYIQTVEGFSAEITAIKKDKLDSNAFESFKTNEFNVTVDGFDTKISSLETNKLDDTEFETFKTNDYQVTVNGFNSRIDSVETNKLDDTEFESFKTNDYQVTVDGLSGHISRVETNKLDSTEFTSFKTNDYDVTVSGFQTALTDKLDEETFNTFKTNEFDVTVNGINGSIESLQTEKLDSADFNTFKSNDYEVTVDGLRMDLTSVSGSMPTIIMGVEWDKSQNPELTRTDYLEYDNPNLYSPNFIMGVRWDKSENPELYRTDDTGGVDDYEYSQQTAQFTNDISGISGRVENVETNKLGTNEFTSFKTNTYAVDLAGLRTNITSLDEGKLGSNEFADFKTNVFDVSVSGLSGRIGTVETEKLDSETYDNFKTNTYDVDVSGLRSRMSSVESKKLDSGTFETFRDTTYSNTIEGITGNITSLQEDKLDGNDFDHFKQNEYEVTVDGLKMGLTDVQGSFPTIVLGVEWDKSSDPKLTRTDYSEVGNPNLYAPSFIMGVMWDKKESPTMYRVADTGGVGDYEFTALQADYNFTKENWSTRLSQIENAGYATQTWSNQTFATPQSVTTQLQSYAKTTDLNGMVTETTLATKNYTTAGAVNTLLTSYAKTDNVPTATQFNSLKNRYDSMEQTIGTTNDSVARAVMTSSLWETEVSKVIDGELEQEYKTVLAPVNVVNGKEFNRGEAFDLGKYFYYSRDVVDRSLYNGTEHTLEITMPATQNRGQSVALETRAYGDTEWVPTGVDFNFPTGQNKVVHEFTSSTFATSVADYRLIVYDDGNTSLTTVYSLRVYTNEEVQVPIEDGNTGAIGSKITQLYDMINLSVLGKEGAMSRIAMGEEGIQIDGKLLHITAKTFIDEAVIKSAMIDTLDAGKITTGELNASLVRVVNLDANSITGNEANFIQAMFSGAHSTLQITGNGVRVLDNLGRSSTYLDSTGIEISRQGIDLGKMQYVTNVSATGDLSGMHGIVMRPNRGSYFAVSYLPTAGTTQSVRRFAVSGETGNVYMGGLIKPSEQQRYGLDITWGTITGRSTNIEIYNHDRTGGIHIANGDLYYLTSAGWRSLNTWIT